MLEIIMTQNSYIFTQKLPILECMTITILPQICRYNTFYIMYLNYRPTDHFAHLRNSSNQQRYLRKTII